MAKKNNFKQQNKDYLRLSIWILVGLALVVINYVSLVFIKSIVASEVFGWTILFGGQIYLLAVMLVLFIIDFIYLILFLRYLFFGKINDTKNTVYLP